MSIIIDKENRLFTLHTRSSTYQMKADRWDTLLHLYYGERTDSSDKSSGSRPSPPMGFVIWSRHRCNRAKKRPVSGNELMELSAIHRA